MRNACPCGYYGDPIKPCTRSASTVTKHQKRISGPLLDRIDVHVEVPHVDYQTLSDDRLGESSDAIQRRVEAAREIPRRRFADGHASESRNLKIGAVDLVCNAGMRVGKRSGSSASCTEPERACCGLRPGSQCILQIEPQVLGPRISPARPSGA